MLVGSAVSADRGHFRYDSTTDKGPVCDLDGRVHGQRGLYMLDGALIPGTTAGCAPSMTIAAIAERAIDNITAADLGTAI